MGDVVRIGGKMMTRSRAFALGLIDEKENLTPKGLRMADTVGMKAEAAREREAEWRRRQGLPPIEEPVATTPDGQIKRRRKPKPLVPRNVDHEGNEVTDEETLQAIADAAAAKADAVVVEESDDE
jgi:hypothetical protein